MDYSLIVWISQLPQLTGIERSVTLNYQTLKVASQAMPALKINRKCSLRNSIRNHIVKMIRELQQSAAAGAFERTIATPHKNAMVLENTSVLTLG